jgi:hypothetical protein
MRVSVLLGLREALHKLVHGGRGTSKVVGVRCGKVRPSQTGEGEVRRGEAR